MADKIVSWGGFDSKGTSGMGVTGSFSVSGSMTTNADIFLYSTSSRTSNIRFFGQYGAVGQGNYHNLAVDSNNDFVWTSFRGGSYSTTPLTLSGGSSWLIPGTMKIGGINVASISSNGSYTGAYATLTLTGGGYNDATNPSINFITWDAGNTTSRFQIHSRTLGGTNGKIVAVPDNGNFIIGSSTDLSAKLAVKGSGTTSSTTAFLVQNANATASLTIKDDLSITAAGSIILQQPGSSNIITINPTGSNFLRYYQAGAFEGNLMTFSGGTVTFPSTVIFTNGLASSGIITTNNIGVDNSNTNRYIRFWKSGFATRVTITHTDAGTLQFRVFDSYDDTTGGVGMYITQQGNAGLTGSLTVGSLSNLSEDQRMSITNPGTYYGDMFGLTLPSSFDPGVMYQTAQGGTNWNGQITSGSNIITSYPAGNNYNPNYASYISVGDYVRDANSGFRARVLTVSATTMSLDRNIAVSYTGSNYTFWPRAYGHTAGTLVYNTTTNKVNYWTTSSLNVLLDSSGSQAITGSLTITGSNAAVTMPSRPAFRVVGAGTTNNLTVTQNGDGTLNQNNWTVDYQQGSALTGSTGVFTAPLAGLYQISLVGRNSGYSSGVSQLAVVKYFGASNAVQAMVEWASSSTMNHAGGSSITYMNAGDLLRLKVLAGEINFDINDNWSVAYIG